MDTKTFAEELVKRSLKKGADAAEVYLENGRNLSLDIRNGEIETVEEASSQGVGFRVFLKGRMAFASSNDYQPAALDGAISRAIEFARNMTADENNVLPEDTSSREVSGLYDPQIAKIPLDMKIELAKRVEKLAMKDPRITKSAGASYGEGENEVVIANSHGLLKSYRTSGCSFGVAVVAEKGHRNRPAASPARGGFTPT